jgi:hypothetical protein
LDESMKEITGKENKQLRRHWVSDNKILMKKEGLGM